MFIKPLIDISFFFLHLKKIITSQDLIGLKERGSNRDFPFAGSLPSCCVAG